LASPRARRLSQSADDMAKQSGDAPALVVTSTAAMISSTPQQPVQQSRSNFMHLPPSRHRHLPQQIVVKSAAMSKPCAWKEALRNLAILPLDVGTGCPGHTLIDKYGYQPTCLPVRYATSSSWPQDRWPARGCELETKRRACVPVEVHTTVMTVRTLFIRTHR